mgnify:CR=1 FL=1
MTPKGLNPLKSGLRLRQKEVFGWQSRSRSLNPLKSGLRLRRDTILETPLRPKSLNPLKSGLRLRLIAKTRKEKPGYCLNPLKSGLRLRPGIRKFSMVRQPGVSIPSNRGSVSVVSPSQQAPQG